MKLTRKHLNLVLLGLPDPSLVVQGLISPYIEIPICKPLQRILDTEHGEQAVVIKKLTFEYDRREMDWVLKDLDV